MIFIDSYKFANLLPDGYPAALAYSLRKLRTDYTGSAIRVRRSSDNAELDIGFVDDELDQDALRRFTGVNLAAWSENFAYWTGSEHITDNQATNPIDGAMTADYVNFTGSLVNQDIYLTFLRYQNLTGRTFTGSVWLKGTAGQTVNLRMDGWGLDGSYSTIVLTSSWVRYSITHTYGAVTNTPIFRFGSRNLSTPAGTAKQFYCYGALITETATVGEYARTLAVPRATADNAFVTTWYDQSTNGNNTTQTTAIRQPRIVNAGVIDTTNGKPALVFDGTDDRLINASVAIAGDITYSIVATYQKPGVGNAQSVLLIPTQLNTGSVQELNYPNLDTAYEDISFNRNGNVNGFTGFGVDTALANGSQVHHFFNYIGVDPNNINSYGLDINGATQSLTNSGPFVYFPEIMCIGARNQQSVNFLNGKIQEIIVYDTDQTTNKTAIESNINTYYSIY